MAVFRVERNTGYTVMSNHHLRNKELSLKAKGLLSQMLSLPEDWDYTLAGLSYINRESIDAIRTAVWELEKAGYITRRQGRDEKGKMTAIEYTIYEQPQPPGDTTPELDCPILENPTPGKPILENPTTDNPTSENPTQLNKDISKTDLPKKEKSNTDLSITHSIPIHSGRLEQSPIPIGDGFTAAFASPLPSVHPLDILVGIAGAVIIRLVVYTKGKNAKKYRKGIEYGSARWGNAEDIKPYIDPVFENNVLLTQTERLMMSSRPKQPKYARNKNILVIGGSGSGKTRFFVKPNLMQMHSSYVVTDPKGTVLIECGKLLQRGGYKIKVLNTINFKKSMRYNPFAYIRSEKDILKLVNTIIANTKGDGDKSGEDFWVSATRSQTVKSLRTSNGFPLFGELVV